MAGNSFGTFFRITTAGESHGAANIVIIDGVPPQLPLTEADIQPDLDRRRPGQSKLTTQRRESDRCQILSGVFEGKTTGTPVAILVPNEDQRSKDYSDIKDKYRPSHADFTFDKKYGVRDYRGGGRSSARETVARVAAGAVAKKILKTQNIELLCYTKQVGSICASEINPETVQSEAIEANAVRCPDEAAAAKMINLIDSVRKELDSIGGVAELVIRGVPAGLGEPVFDKLRADLGKAMFSLPAVMGVEFGSGFSTAEMRGSAHNDVFETRSGEIKTRSNNHGGMLGGISSGMPIVLRCAIKPTSSIAKEQETVNTNGESTTISTKGRHDPCLLPRFMPMAEAMAAITVLDHFMRQNAIKGL